MAGPPVVPRGPGRSDWADAYRDRTIAVTGASGFLGGALVDRLADTAHHLVRVSRRPLPPLTNVRDSNVTDLVGDISDPQLWMTIVENADVVVHLAAQTSLADAEANPAHDAAVNVAPLHYLREACMRLARQPVVLFAGTVTQAGAPVAMPVDEDVNDVPLTTYDAHKLAAERALKAAVGDGVFRGASLRLPNVYGPGRSAHADRHVLNQMIRRAIRGEALTVFGAGAYVRDYLFVEDAVEAFLMAGAHIEAVNGHHYVVGTGTGTTIGDAFELVAERVAAVTGRRVPVTSVEPSRSLMAIEQRNFIANAARFHAATGWQPRWTLRDGLDRTIEAYGCA